jgi:hypothetical protein
MEPNVVFPMVAIGVSVCGLLFQHFAVTAKIQERITRLETKVELFWSSIEKSVAPMLKSYPTNVEKDILLDKMTLGELSLDEAYHLRTILMEEAKIERDKAIAYALALARLEQIIYDLKRKACK